jgi:hypothetical protein
MFPASPQKNSFTTAHGSVSMESISVLGLYGQIRRKKYPRVQSHCMFILKTHWTHEYQGELITLTDSGGWVMHCSHRSCSWLATQRKKCGLYSIQAIASTAIVAAFILKWEDVRMRLHKRGVYNAKAR